MRIMFVIPRMNGGGAERVVANLSNYFCREHDVRLVTLVDGKSYYPLNDKIEYRNQPMRINRKNILTTLGCYARYFWKTKKYIEKNIDEFQPDCVISFLVEADFLVHLTLKRRCDIVTVFSERADPTRRNPVRQMLAKQSYKNCDLFVCQSKKMQDYYLKIPKNRKVVIPNPLDVSVLPEIVPEEDHNIVAVGRLTEQKNFELLINGFVASIDKLPSDCNLLIYGDGPLRSDLQQMINVNDMGDRIKLMGSKKNVLNEIRGSALFVMSSDFEGFPNVLLEAMALGLPVISTDFYTGVARELIKKENGEVIKVGDEKGLSKAMSELMNDETKRRKMRAHNVLVREKYCVEKIGNMWLENISKIMEAKHEG